MSCLIYLMIFITLIPKKETNLIPLISSYNIQRIHHTRFLTFTSGGKKIINVLPKKYGLYIFVGWSNTIIQMIFNKGKKE